MAEALARLPRLQPHGLRRQIMRCDLSASESLLPASPQMPDLQQVIKTMVSSCFQFNFALVYGLIFRLKVS
jgi:hypothetical protein